MGASKKSYPQDQIQIENCTKFCKAVEDLVSTSNQKADLAKSNGNHTRPRLNYIQAVLAVAERFGIEESMAAAYLNQDIKGKIQTEAENLNMIAKGAKLPF